MIRHLTATMLTIGGLTAMSGSTAVSVLAVVTGSDSAPAAVERPGEQYRGSYQLDLGKSRRLLR